MVKRIGSFVAVAALAAGPASAQDPAAALQAAMDTMGVTDMTSIRYTGSGWVGAVGQNASPAEDWPRFELAEYERTIDFETNSSMENMIIRQGGYPARGGGGAPIQGDRIRNPRVRGEYAWDAPGVDRVVPTPQNAELRLLEIFLTPHGFLQGARAGDPIAITRNEYGQRVTVVSYIALGKYRINGTITEDNVVERVQTWVPSPVVGDMYYETVYTDYRDVGGGMMFPFNWHQHQDYDDGANEPNVSGGDHSFSLTTIDSVEVNVDGAALTVPDIVRNATVPPMRVESEEVADGVWLIGGGSHNSVAVEFADYVAVVEAPLDEARSLAVIEEIVRLVPDKPIRYVINTHQHHDHVGGLRTYMHIGATIVTQWRNYDFYRSDVLNYAPRTLAPDMLSLWPPTELAEGYQYETVRENYALTDGSRTMHISYVQPLRHVEGMLMAYLPAERMIIESELFNPPPPGAPQPAATDANRSLVAHVQRLGLNVETIVPLHGQPAPWSDLLRIVESGP